MGVSEWYYPEKFKTKPQQENLMITLSWFQKIKYLDMLDLSDNKLDDASAEDLPSFKTQNLAGNRIRSAGARALAAAELQSLVTLNLRGNCLRCKGAEALAFGQMFNLIFLYISTNRAAKLAEIADPPAA